MATFFGAAESVSKFAPDRFRATLTNGFGLASPNRFEVEFPKLDGMAKPNGGDVFDKTTSEDRNLLCTAAGMPGKQLSFTNRGATLGMENQLVVNGHTMPEVSFSFYLTNTYGMREYFERWMQVCSSTGPDEVQFAGYYKEYSQKDVKVRAYTRNGRRAYTVDLINCFPTNVGEVQFNNQRQGAAAEMTVSIAYRTYKTKQEKTSPLG